ncbi:nucleotidyl transferase AbiEii/AbiGii toxin family protein [Rhizobacter sp. P5_C2]
MPQFAHAPITERSLIFTEVSARLGLTPVIVEKDFWVCWALGRLFASPEISRHVIFKGGTSLSKVYAAIRRFSEDIDLAVSPAALGFDENELIDAPSASQRRKRMQQLAIACEDCVRQRFQPALEASLASALGPAPGGSWLTFEIDATAGTPNLLFNYPSALPQPGGYVEKQVKLEFGALTNQQPSEQRQIIALLANAPGASLASAFDDMHADVVALSFERTFWEKVTILHAEYHRPTELPIRDRFARHYADVASLWAHPQRDAARARLDLLQDVVTHKSHFFASAWANYQTAMPGTLRLVPPSHRHSALAQDYSKMQPMFMDAQPSFEELLDQLAQAEHELNR